MTCSCCSPTPPRPCCDSDLLEELHYKLAGAGTALLALVRQQPPPGIGLSTLQATYWMALCPAGSIALWRGGSGSLKWGYSAGQVQLSGSEPDASALPPRGALLVFRGTSRRGGGRARTGQDARRSRGHARSSVWAFRSTQAITSRVSFINTGPSLLSRHRLDACRLEAASPSTRQARRPTPGRDSQFRRPHPRCWNHAPEGAHHGMPVRCSTLAWSPDGETLGIGLSAGALASWKSGGTPTLGRSRRTSPAQGFLLLAERADPRLSLPLQRAALWKAMGPVCPLILPSWGREALWLVAPDGLLVADLEAHLEFWDMRDLRKRLARSRCLLAHPP